MVKTYFATIFLMLWKRAVFSVTYNSSVTGHEASHDLPLQCPMCDKRFGRKDYLNCHFSLHHADNKLFKCQFCDKPVYDLSSKLQHERKCPLSVAGVVSSAVKLRTIFDEEYVFEDPIVPWNQSETV
jgi:hypothetical protein